MRSTKIRYGWTGAAITVLVLWGLTAGAQAQGQFPVRDTVCNEDRKAGVVYFATHAIAHPFGRSSRSAPRRARVMCA